ncbi:MAG: DUF1800 domain-containing protein [Gloeomargaritaceae cyanobacterium C42_A2020_066]|nr:DUF1800 domain-containing protein [Gloeomargaritaceae cyanobacterium C42_A2020_066]
MLYRWIVVGVALGGMGIAAGRAAAPDLPYRQAGLTERQAALHLLNRFSFGPRPQEVDQVVQMGLNRWLDTQLAQRPDPDLQNRLKHLTVLQPGGETSRFSNRKEILAAAQQAGLKLRELGPDATPAQKAAFRKQLNAFIEQKGITTRGALQTDLMAQKILRATYSQNQLAEVLSDFWYNHFYVSRRDRAAALWILDYEMRAIRPHALGKFPDLLRATAQHPAMLLYLDNAQSSAGPEALTLGNRRRPQPQGEMAPKRARGLNENYARELLELHTLGVDGGYTQQDVIEVARTFTGWTLLPDGKLRQKVMAATAGAPVAPTFRGDFAFIPSRHDAGPKLILGQRFPGNQGLAEGEQVLTLLAGRPATAQHIARKLAIRFVSDTPPPALVERLSQTFLRTGGDTPSLIRTLVASPEFWQPAAQRAKIKSPFELVISALRGLNAEVTEPEAVVRWLERLGQPLYAYPAPSGYPDQAEAWVNTGALLNRMSFALDLSAGRIPGVTVQLVGRPTDTLNSALERYSALLLPEVNPGQLRQRVMPLLENPQSLGNLEALAPAMPMDGQSMTPAENGKADKGKKGEKLSRRPRRTPEALPSVSAQVVGVLIGSPEFQRR